MSKMNWQQLNRNAKSRQRRPSVIVPEKQLAKEAAQFRAAIESHRASK